MKYSFHWLFYVRIVLSHDLIILCSFLMTGRCSVTIALLLTLVCVCLCVCLCLCVCVCLCVCLCASMHVLCHIVMNNVIPSTVDDDGDEMVCSPSVDTLESINSYDVVSYLSEQGVLP